MIKLVGSLLKMNLFKNITPKSLSTPYGADKEIPQRKGTLFLNLPLKRFIRFESSQSF